MRLVADEDGFCGCRILPGKAHGRGAWTHPRVACLQETTRGGLARSLRRPVRVEMTVLVEQMRASAVRRARGLISAAAGARKLLFGAAEVERGLKEGRVRLLIVACGRESGVESPRGPGRDFRGLGGLCI